MRRSCVGLLRIPVVVFIAVLFAGCSGQSDHLTSAERLQASITENWNAYKQAHGLTGGGLAVYIESPSGNHFASTGMPVGIDQNTRFRIASNTKTFTAAAIMLLDQQGMLHIDDYITSLIPGRSIPYVPDTPAYNLPNKASITIRRLLSHTAGVFDVTNDPIPSSCAAPYAGQSYPAYIRAADPNHQFWPEELIGVDAACELSCFAPGTAYKYSNTGYSVLATIIEQVSGMPYDEFIRQNLIIPNGLVSTSVPVLGTDQTIPAPFTPGYLYYLDNLYDVTEDNMSVNIAEGNIISTPAILARWVRRLLRGEAGPNRSSVEKMKTTTPQSGENNYGLGISYKTGLGYGHEGAHVGYLSLMVYDPDKDVTVILYFNVWDLANWKTEQAPLMSKIARDARAATGY